MANFTFSTRRRSAGATGTPGRELTDSERRALPLGFEAVGEALVSGTNPAAACAEVGRALARDGASLGEALDGLSATYERVLGREPAFAAAESLWVAWSEATLEFLHQLSCEDPLTGLASCRTCAPGWTRSTARPRTTASTSRDGSRAGRRRGVRCTRAHDHFGAGTDARAGGRGACARVFPGGETRRPARARPGRGRRTPETGPREPRSMCSGSTSTTSARRERDPGLDRGPPGHRRLCSQTARRAGPLARSSNQNPRPASGRGPLL